MVADLDLLNVQNCIFFLNSCFLHWSFHSFTQIQWSFILLHLVLAEDAYRWCDWSKYWANVLYVLFFVDTMGNWLIGERNMKANIVPAPLERLFVSLNDTIWRHRPVQKSSRWLLDYLVGDLTMSFPHWSHVFCNHVICLQTWSDSKCMWQPSSHTFHTDATFSFLQFIASVSTLIWLFSPTAI